MPQTMVEAFARGLVDKIMLEALDVLDTDAADDGMMLEAVDVFDTNDADEKHCALEEDNAESMSETESSHIDVEAQVHEENRPDYANYSQQEAAAVIAKMICGLRNVHIGDSTYVLPPVLSSLERQVKKAAAAIELNSALCHISDPPQARTPQGQGDVDRAMQNAVLDAPIELEPSSTTQRKDKETSGCEATKVSLSLLHRMIEDLQTKSSSNLNTPPPIKDDIAHWEEEHETFVRLIDCETSKHPDHSEKICFLQATPHSKQSTSPINSSSPNLNISSNKPPASTPSTCLTSDQHPDLTLDAINPQIENSLEKALTSLMPPNDPEDAIDKDSSLSDPQTDSTRRIKADCFSEIPIKQSSPIPSPPRSPPSSPPSQPQSVPGPSDILLDSQRDSTDAKRKRKRRSLLGKAKRLFSAAFRRRKH